MNLVLFYADLDANVIQGADVVHRACAQAATERGEGSSYTGLLATQRYGPLRTIVIPEGHRRQSRFPLFNKFLKDTAAAREVDFGDIHVALYRNDFDAALDCIPMDMHPDLVPKVYRT